MQNERAQKYLPIAVVALIVIVVLAAVVFIIQRPNSSEEEVAALEATRPGDTTLSGDAAAIAQARGLTPDDVVAALKTYMPTGQLDEYVLFGSGGHSGQVLVVGLPSMRLLKVIAVFTPEPWQGWGYGAESTMDILAGGDINGQPVTWADTHHPALSETNGEYDGQFLFIGDKANSRVAVIDLRDFETKQILKNPVAINDHGGTFVTPNTEWVVEGGQYAAPLGWEYASLEGYAEDYRGLVTFWKFDRETGRINPEESFAMELPPYWQDLCDAGKKVSEGWVFCNSINTEMGTGGIELGNPPFEASTTQRDMDYLHIFNLDRAAEVAAAGNVVEVNGFNVIPLETAIDEGLLYFAPEPKSPHGVDVTPGGEYMVVAGKLDPHVTVYSFAKIQAAIEAGNLETDDYGVPILNFDDVMEAQVELGLGPLHTQFDNQGYAYTSLFLDSAVARWSLGGPYDELNSDPGWALVAKESVHYNIGHLVTAEGDTASPDGNYLVSLNKWSVDRFLNVGPLLPQNFQLIDISQPGDNLQLLYDMPIGVGEPHYAQIIKADKLQAWEVYPEIGWDPHSQSVDPTAAQLGQERIERNGDTVEIWMTAVRSHFTPERIEIKQGDHVIWHITNVERARDATHGFAIPGYNINLSIEPGESITIEFDATQDGVFSYYCTEFCSALHLEMTGYLLVQP
ncbi:MAG: Sec-dependent nitrous-oxide reductase [Chloroflexi bacterium]|nr:Sec-dependent nitrous-oxide reductase [Chloroflexota bacterium]MCI0577838.1 Sec-dependent nitrous-oxide reductase [Chloroflexota bacterium]MCI0646135.1 Sec-dependent nitrous-oxide reductase [Chloroflexota bacterium]MCI0731337.1 Sec-dependent nitrous-oxide reductase [Chloroflexota bacterium]